MPSPRKIDGRNVWDIQSLDVAFDQLPSRMIPTRAARGTTPDGTRDHGYNPNSLREGVPR